MKPKTLRIIIIVLASAFLSLCGCRSGSGGADEGGGLMSLYDRAEDLRSEGRYDDAAKLFMDAGALYSPSMTEEEKTVCIDAMQKAGFIYLYDIHSRVLAYPMLRKALDVSLDENIPAYLPVIYMNLANIYHDFSDSGVSDKWIGKAFDMDCRGFYSSLERKDWKRLSTIMMNLCSVYAPICAPGSGTSGIEDVDSLMRGMIVKFLNAPIPAQNAERRYARHLALATLEMLDGNYSRALDLYKSTSISPEIDTLVVHHLKSQRLDNISRAHEALGHTDSAVAMQKMIIKEAITNSLPEIEAYACHNLSRLYASSDADESRRWRLRYFEKSDSLRILNDRNTMGEIELQHKLNMEKASLEESRHKEATRNIFILFCLVILMVSAASIVVLLIKHRKLSQRNDMLYQKNMELARLADPDEAGVNNAKYASSPISDEDKEYLLRQIEKALSEPATVCDSELSVSTLAAALKSNKSYVSQIINEHYGVNFRMLLGNLRVNEALRRIDAEPERYGNITVDALASETGFRSRATFTSAFRRVTGMTPAEFIRIARRRHASGDPEQEEPRDESDK